MAVGKNKGLSKGGKKGVKKKVVDPFTRKEWYDIKGPVIFKNTNIGKTLVNKTQGTRIASEGLKGSVICNLTYYVVLIKIVYILKAVFSKFLLLICKMMKSHSRNFD